MKSIKFTTAFSLIFLIGLGFFTQSCKVTEDFKIAKKGDFVESNIAGEADLELLYNGLNTGTNIKLKKLVYYLDNPLRISNKNNFTLDGNGCTFIMKNKDEDVMIVEHSTNVIVKNFKATHIEPDGPIGCTGSVIQVRQSNNVLIEKCALNGSGIIGVTSYGTKKLQIVGNYIYNNSQYGILYDAETSIEIRNNKFEDNGTGRDKHVVKALNSFLSQVMPIKKDVNEEGLIMSGNIYK